MLAAYTRESGVPISREAREELWNKTRGQPWLVSRILYQIDEQRGEPRQDSHAEPSAESPTAQEIRAICDQLLGEDCVHLLSVSDAVKDRREAQELLLRLLSGEEIRLDRSDEVQSYLLDVGLLTTSDAAQLLEIANPIYESYLLRILGD